jgi:hypothetical protein
MPSPSRPAPLIEPPGDGPAPRRYLAPMVARKRLGPAEQLAAAGVGLAVGAVVAYVTALWMQRTPLGGEPRPPRTVAPGGPATRELRRRAAGGRTRA